MPLFAGRSDGVLLNKLPGFKKMFPFLMVTRTGSAIVFQQQIRLKKALALLDRLNRGRAEHPYTLFHLVLAALVRTLALRPENNRFVVGRRIYQRKAIEVTFIVKRALTEQASETQAKVAFAPDDSVESVAEKVRSAVQATKASSTSRDESLSDLVSRLPRCLIRTALWGWRALDYFNLLPAKVLAGDGLYTSVYVANLGSIGLDAVQHHLYEWGTCSFFLVLGREKKGLVVGELGEPVVEEVITTSVTLDERISDGVNFAKTIQLFTALVEEPEPLLSAPSNLPDPFAAA